MYGGHRRFGHASHGASSAERVDQSRGWGFHTPGYAIIGTASQAKTSDYRHCDSRNGVPYGAMRVSKLLPEAEEVFRRLAAARRTQKELADILGLEPNKVTKLKTGERQFKGAELIQALAWLDRVERDADQGRGSNKISARSSADDDDTPMVGIRHADAAFGLGAAFTDEPTEVQVLQFPKVWVQSITYSPAELLSWVRARGRSMEPTISDGDLILLDHSERKVSDQDDLWAFTVGDTRAIKRLRVKGDRYQILSDNPSVPPDEEPIDFVNIVARVVFVGKRT
jgi:phage repressor protein C with HTH and peptisase S24 domain